LFQWLVPKFLDTDLERAVQENEEEIGDVLQSKKSKQLRLQGYITM
jgi:hypothetical protein